MNGGIPLGPLLLPLPLLVVFASVGAAFWIGARLGRRAGVDGEAILWQALLVGGVVARLAFVAQFASVYSSSPLSIVDIRDGGWSPLAGFAAAWLYGCLLYTSRCV